MLRPRLESGKKETPVRPNRRARFSVGAVQGLVWLMAEGLAVLIAVLIGIVVVMDRAEVRLPFAAGMLAERLSETLPGQHFEIASLSVSMAHMDRFTGVTAYDVRLVDAEGRVLLSVPQVEVKFTLLDLLKGEVRPERVQILGAKVFARKTASGAFRLSLGEESVAFDTANGTVGRDLNDVISGTEFLREVPELRKLAEVAFTGAVVNYRDDAIGRSWRIDRGKLVLRSHQTGYSASISGKLAQADGQGSEVNISAKQNVASGTSSVIAEFRNTSPFDLADQFPALDWLRILDAPASGKLELEIAANGALASFGGALDIGSGVIVQHDAPDVAFQSARSRFTYDPATGVFDVSELNVASDSVRVTSAGKIILGSANGTNVDSLIAQLDLRDIAVFPPGGFADALVFPAGRATARVSLEPFAVTIGEMVVFDGNKRLFGSGDIRTADGNWVYTLDLGATSLSAADLLAYWPEIAAPKARAWVAQNILSGTISRVAGGIRSTKAAPEFTLQFEFADTTARFLKFMPTASDVAGFGTLNQKSFEINIVQGSVDVQGKGRVVADGTRVVFPQYRLKPAPTMVDLVAEGDFPAVFDLLNRPPLSLLDKGGADPGIAQGHALIRSRLEFPAKKTLQLSEIVAEATAELTDVSTTRLANGLPVSADTLAFSAKDGDMRIAGNALVETMPVSFEWRRDYGPGAPKGSEVHGTIPLNVAALARLGIAVPGGSVKGQTQGAMDIRVIPGQPPSFTLKVDLAPLDLTIGALGWSKSNGEAGTATLEGRLTEPITFGAISVAAGGLVGNGSLDLRDGKFRGAQFDRLAVDGWLDAAVDYAPGAARISGGEIDLRRRTAGRSDGSTEVTLDNTAVIVTDTISLANASGSFRSGSSLEGGLKALVNGGAQVDVALRPAEDGQRITVTGTDAGQILRDAGLFRNALGGDLRLTMVQTGGPGKYRGAFEMHNLRVKDAPVLAALLSAASIIGFLEQLDGNGLAFITVSGSFTMADGIITLTRAKAVGASIGISLEGRYRLNDKQFDMNGVISPLYAINGIFEKLPIIGRLLGGKDGEGLIGFSYLLRGSAQAPKISVNPLSILTPGALREIFVPRRAPVPGQ